MDTTTYMFVVLVGINLWSIYNSYNIFRELKNRDKIIDQNTEVMKDVLTQISQNMENIFKNQELVDSKNNLILEVLLGEEEKENEDTKQEHTVELQKGS